MHPVTRLVPSSSWVAVVCGALGLLAPAALPARRAVPEPVPAATRAALDGIRADALRAHVSFLASDFLEGRATPSPGLEIAAEYLAAQFRRCGLQSAGEDGYFQNAPLQSPDRGRERRRRDRAEARGQATARAGRFQLLAPAPDAFLVAVQRSAPVERRLQLRNVAGLLRGSDPELRDTFVLVSAHYDHLGIRPGGEGDRIFNGANDDASGTASMLEIAAALATLPRPPKRSLLFIAWAGEEKGLLGSRYYADRPLVPLEQTAAMVNLEHMGRTDAPEGPQVNRLSVTGFDYSTVTGVLRAAGERLGVAVVKHPRNSDVYFNRSDNRALAERGVPAHTVWVAFDYPDYHAVGDHWEKLDYANMERVTRAVALAIQSLAEDPQEPRWKETVPAARRYLKAWRERRR